jgi:hypothetical protein
MNVEIGRQKILDITRLHSFISGNTYTVNQNQTFILDSHWPFICSVLPRIKQADDEGNAAVLPPHRITLDPSQIFSYLKSMRKCKNLAKLVGLPWRNIFLTVCQDCQIKNKLMEVNIVTSPYRTFRYSWLVYIERRHIYVL